MIEVHKPEGGLWTLRDTETGKDLDRGPYVQERHARKVADQLDAEAGQGAAEEWAVAGVPEAEAETPKPRKRREKPAAEEPKPETPALDPWEITPEEQAAMVAKRALIGSHDRHTWLEAAAKLCRLHLAKVEGFTLPDNVRVTVGWPYASRGSAVIGQCFHAEASKDGVREVFVSPKLDDTITVLGTLLHEMVHAGLNPEAKHGPDFKRVAVAAGLAGKMTATVPGEELEATFKQWVADGLGEYPVGGLDPGLTHKPQTTRLLKAECTTCGYTVRVTRKWVAVAVPTCPDEDCPDHGATMAVEGGE